MAEVSGQVFLCVFLDIQQKKFKEKSVGGKADSDVAVDGGDGEEREAVCAHLI